MKNTYIKARYSFSANISNLVNFNKTNKCEISSKQHHEILLFEIFMKCSLADKVSHLVQINRTGLILIIDYREIKH